MFWTEPLGRSRRYGCAPRPAIALGSTDGPLFYRIRRLVTGADEYGPSKLTGTIALTLGLACLALCVNWVRAQEPARLSIQQATSSTLTFLAVRPSCAELRCRPF